MFFTSRSIRLLTIPVLQLACEKLHSRAAYCLFLRTLTPNCPQKVASFIIPKIKDFLLSPAGQEIDQELIWNRLLLEDTAELASKADFVIPVLNLIKSLELHNQIQKRYKAGCIRQGLKLFFYLQEGEYSNDFKLKYSYMRFIQDDVHEARKYYELKVEEGKDAKEKAFFAQAMTQIELIGFINNSILELMGLDLFEGYYKKQDSVYRGHEDF